MERKQGFACIALSCALFAGSFGLMGAVAADTGSLIEGATAMADEGASALADGEVSLASASLDESEASSAYEALEEAFDGLKTYVPVGGRFTDEELEDAYNLLKKERPDLFFMDGVSYTYDKDSGKVLAIRPEYVAELSEVRDMRDEYRAAVKQALATIDGTETSAEAATKVHDWLANRTEYDYEAAEDASKASWSASSSYGALVLGKAVCTGYAAAYKDIMGRLGADCSYVTSVSMAHAWNLLLVDGRYLHVDVTFDDTASGPLGASHKYLLKTDDEMQELGHSGWEADHESV